MTHGERTARLYRTRTEQTLKSQETAHIAVTAIAMVIGFLFLYGMFTVAAAAFSPCDPTVYADGTPAPCQSF